jgi:hypothetical protein
VKWRTRLQIALEIDRQRRPRPPVTLAVVRYADDALAGPLISGRAPPQADAIGALLGHLAGLERL